MLQHDRSRDLAVLQVGTSRLPVPAGISSTAPRVGELAIAVGNPLGFIGAVSTGVVHAVGPIPGIGTRQWVQTTVRLAPGSSGGPLANARGEVIGVNTMIVGRGSMANLAVAIPIASALQFVSEPKTARIGLGITVRPVSVPGESMPGFLILETAPDHPADRASLLMGDLLIGANGRRFRRFSDLQQAIDSVQAGGLLSLQFRRGGALNERTVTIQVEERRAAA